MLTFNTMKIRIILSDVSCEFIFLLYFIEILYFIENSSSTTLPYAKYCRNFNFALPGDSFYSPVSVSCPDCLQQTVVEAIVMHCLYYAFVRARLFFGRLWFIPWNWELKFLQGTLFASLQGASSSTTCQ